MSGYFAIASQLEPRFNAALSDRLGAPIDAIGRFPDADLTRYDILIAAPFSIEQRHAPEPSGWPGRLRWIQLVTSGTDLYPDWFLQGPRITTARGVAAEAIGEYCLAAIFDRVKQLAALRVSTPRDWRVRWSDTVAGRSLGLFGFGAIGGHLARLAQGLGMSVSALRRSGPDSSLNFPVYWCDSLSELIERSDHLVIAAPLTESTRGIFDRDALAHGRALHLINIARGELLETDALLQALESGHVDYAHLDATAPEPLPEQHLFYRHPRIFLSPHTSAISWRSRANLIDKFIGNLARLNNRQPLRDELRR